MLCVLYSQGCAVQENTRVLCDMWWEEKALLRQMLHFEVLIVIFSVLALVRFTSVSFGSK